MRIFTIFTCITLFVHCHVFSQYAISIEVKPAKILIEKGESRQYINFDFLVNNASADSFTLTRLSISILNATDKIIHSRFLDNNGTAPSIFIIPNRSFNGKVSNLIFNPFPEFNLSMPLNKLIYEWIFTSNTDEEIKIITTVHPKNYEQHAAYKFPLKGNVLVYDAHDFYAHHRRFNYEFAPIKNLGLVSNFMRYAYDFVLLNENNKEFRGDEKKDENYIGFGKPVYVIGAGKIIYATNNFKDDKTFNIPALATNPLELYGNCIAIQHADSSISIYGHLKQNSLKVKTGESVISQQQIAAIGVSGSSFFPHLHFEMRTSILNNSQGIPSYFSNVFLQEGKTSTKLKSGLVETGNIIQIK